MDKDFKKVIKALMEIRYYCRNQDCINCKLKGNICHLSLDAPFKWNIEKIEEDNENENTKSER